MENNENKKIPDENISKAKSDMNDGYMQIRSSGRAAKTPARAPVSRTPEANRAAMPEKKRTAVKPSQKPAALKKPTERPTAQKKPPQRPTPKKPPEKSVEYSFTNSGLFNNSEIAQNAAIQERNLRRAQNGTKASDKTNGSGNADSVRQDREKQMRTTVVPAQRDIANTRTIPVPRPGKGPGGTRPRTEVKAVQGDAVKNAETKMVDKVNMGPSKKKIKYPPRPGEGNKYSTMNSISRAFIYIAAVLVSSVILSMIIITNANDIFAFVKSDEQMEIKIEEGTDLNVLAKQLKSMGVIKHKNTFKMYIKYRGKDTVKYDGENSDTYIPGTYIVSPSMNYDQIIAAITPVTARESVVVTIPEGFTVDDIIELFVSKFPDTTRQHFVEVIQNYDFDTYWFIKELPKNTDKIYRLEGYLFPDTYYFYTDMTEETIISKLLDNFEKKYSSEYRARATELGYTTDQVVTLASIIQAEGKERIITVSSDDSERTYVDYELISGVFSNRMAYGMKFQSDATTAYAVDMTMAHSANGNSYDLGTYVEPGEYKISDYTNANYEHPYNTYYVSSFPPGGICNPGLNAIAFALWFDRSSYLYFASDSSGNTYFSESLTEHNQIVATLD